MFHEVIAWDNQIATVTLIVMAANREEALVNLVLILSWEVRNLTDSTALLTQWLNQGSISFGLTL
jgi:hypothetical protein